MHVVAVIPARYASSRFPGKPLAMIGDRSMIRRVYENVSALSSVGRTIVATDDQRIFDHVLSFGGEVVMTNQAHPSGTDRVAEVARGLPKADVVVNVQGDEPFVAREHLEKIISAFSDPAVQIATLARPITDEADLLSPNVVKVVRDRSGRGLYFSRHAIPYLRDIPLGQWLREGRHLQHLGLYAYRRETLLRLTELAKDPLEEVESLEQLRWLGAGIPVQVEITQTASFGVDTPADLEKAIAYLEEM